MCMLRKEFRCAHHEVRVIVRDIGGTRDKPDSARRKFKRQFIIERNRLHDCFEFVVAVVTEAEDLKIQVELGGGLDEEGSMLLEDLHVVPRSRVASLQRFWFDGFKAFPL